MSGSRRSAGAEGGAAVAPSPQGVRFEEDVWGRLTFRRRAGTFAFMPLTLAGETGRPLAAFGAEGATAPETLRQKDRERMATLESRPRLS
jgi:hypothetical protein